MVKKLLFKKYIHLDLVVNSTFKLSLCDHGCFFDVNKFSKNLPRTEYEPNLQKFSHLEKVLALTQRIDN